MTREKRKTGSCIKAHSLGTMMERRRQRSSSLSACFFLLFKFIMLSKNLEVSAFVNSAQGTTLRESATSLQTRLTSRASSRLEAGIRIPFIIDEIPREAGDAIYSDISEMCIEAFFNDGPPGRTVTPWKAFQINSLRRMQEGDLKLRRRSHSDSNFMLVARRVVPAESGAALRAPLLLNLNGVVHAAQLPAAEDYVRGPVMGFVEVTTRPYGLGSEDVLDRHRRFHTKRPILTNLSVAYEARQSGVGSLLLERCEQEVLRRWNLPEIILEVEDDNENAISFYDKRGYKVLFEDPTARRFDLEGLWLRQVRCKRKVFRKELKQYTLSTNSKPIKEVQNFGIRVIQGIRDRVFSTV